MYLFTHAETSGLSTRLKSKRDSYNRPEEGDLNEKKYTFYLDVTRPDQPEVPRT